MRSTDERMAKVLERAKVHETEIRRRRQHAVAFGGGCLSVVAVVLVGVGLSASATGASDTASVAGQLGLMGSVFADGSALGYVVVGLFGLALGAAVTAIAFRLGRPAIGVERLSCHSERSEESQRNEESGEPLRGDPSPSAQDDKGTVRNGEGRSQ